jgi:hypothetical protein
LILQHQLRAAVYRSLLAFMFVGNADLVPFRLKEDRQINKIWHRRLRELKFRAYIDKCRSWARPA